MLRDKALKYFRGFMASVPGDVTAFASRKKQLILPRVPKDFVLEIIDEVINITRNEPTLLELKSPISVVGDLHGHLLDLFRIIKSLGSPEARQYLFLGDIVDRGEFSVETIILVYIMKVVWPKNVYIIRGNHEFGYLCSQCGFFSQISDFYGDIKLFRNFLTSFSYLPLSALIDKVTLCVHGGISPSFFSVSQIRTIQKPFDNFGDDSVVDGILWSDPSTEVANFMDSPRGTGYLYGNEATEEFLKSNNLKYIVRGHECVNDGYRVSFGSVITVFSASHYCGIVDNDAAVLNFKKDQTYEAKVFPEMDYLLRNYVEFSKENGGPKQRVELQPKEPQTARVCEPRGRIGSMETLPKLRGKTPRRRISSRYNSKSYSCPKRKAIH